MVDQSQMAGLRRATTSWHAKYGKDDDDDDFCEDWRDEVENWAYIYMNI